MIDPFAIFFGAASAAALIWMCLALAALVVGFVLIVHNGVEKLQAACTRSRRYLSGQWRFGLFLGVCCMVAGVVYGWVVVR